MPKAVIIDDVSYRTIGDFTIRLRAGDEYEVKASYVDDDGVTMYVLHKHDYQAFAVESQDVEIIDESES